MRLWWEPDLPPPELRGSVRMTETLYVRLKKCPWVPSCIQQSNQWWLEQKFPIPLPKCWGFLLYYTSTEQAIFYENKCYFMIRCNSINSVFSCKVRLFHLISAGSDKFVALTSVRRLCLHCYSQTADHIKAMYTVVGNGYRLVNCYIFLCSHKNIRIKLPPTILMYKQHLQDSNQHRRQ